MPKVTVHMTDAPPRRYSDATAAQDDELGLTVTKSDGSRAMFQCGAWQWFEEEAATDDDYPAQSASWPSVNDLPAASVKVTEDEAGIHLSGYITADQVDGILHTGLMTDAQLTQWMGTDATRWAAEFAKRFRVAFVTAWDDAESPLRAVIEELIDPAGGGMLHGWFANAIEHARDVGYDAGARNERDMAHQPVVAYQGNMFGTGDPGVIFVRVMAKDLERLRELVTWDASGPKLTPADVVKLAATWLRR